MQRRSKIFLTIVLSLVVVALVYISTIYFKFPNNQQQPNIAFESASIQVGSARVFIELAKSPTERERGLSGRTKLEPNAGMLFTFDVPNRPGFWMKDMNFPLDFIYIRDGRVVELKENVPAALIPTPFFPSVDIDSVLEVNAGFIKANSIKVGDLVEY